MSANAHTTVRFGDLVAGAFDCAAQCDSDPRNVSFLAAKAVEYVLRRSGKESASMQVSGLLPSVDSRPLLVFGAAGAQPGPSTTKKVDVVR